MEFDKPVKAKRYYSGKAITLCAAAVILFLMPIIVPDIDEFGRGFSFLLSGLLFLTAIYNFWRYKKSLQDSKVYEIIATAPANLQIKYLKRSLILSYFLWPIITIITAWELKELEMGKTESVDLWFPLSVIYTHTGYWPTVLSFVFLGIISVCVLRWKISKLSEETKTIKF